MRTDYPVYSEFVLETVVYRCAKNQIYKNFLSHPEPLYDPYLLRSTTVNVTFPQSFQAR